MDFMEGQSRENESCYKSYRERNNCFGTSEPNYDMNVGRTGGSCIKELRMRLLIAKDGTVERNSLNSSSLKFPPKSNRDFQIPFVILFDLDQHSWDHPPTLPCDSQLHQSVFSPSMQGL